MSPGISPSVQPRHLHHRDSKRPHRCFCPSSKKVLTDWAVPTLLCTQSSMPQGPRTAPGTPPSLLKRGGPTVCSAEAHGGNVTCPFSVVGSWACRVERNIPLQGLALPCMGSAASHFSGTSQPTPFPEPDPREVTVSFFFPRFSLISWIPTPRHSQCPKLLKPSPTLFSHRSKGFQCLVPRPGPQHHPGPFLCLPSPSLANQPKPGPAHSAS